MSGDSTIPSDRLDLISLTTGILRALLGNDLIEAERLLGLPLSKDWLNCPQLLSLRLRQLETDSTLQPWLVRAIVLRNERAVVGHIGFHDRPDAGDPATVAPGGAEFGFTVFPEFRRRGYAAEASEALMNWARKRHGVSHFVLSISPGNTASLALAARLGFRRIGSQIDEVDGPEDVFERRFGAMETDQRP